MWLSHRYFENMNNREKKVRKEISVDALTLLCDIQGACKGVLAQSRSLSIFLLIIKNIVLVVVAELK